MNYFVLDGIEGFVNSMGFVQWHTIGCHIDSIRGCRLERAAQQALDNAAILPEPPEEKNYVL